MTFWQKIPISLSKFETKSLKSLTGDFSKLQPRHKISLSQNKLFGVVEISMAVFLEKACFGLEKFCGEAVILNILQSSTLK